MTHFLGVDIGSYESKGVLVDADGRVIASAVRAHKMLVPRPGWAEHRPEQDWWGDFLFVVRELLATSRVPPADIAAIGCSGIGPCMLPVGADGAPLGNAVLYGVDTRAAAEVEELNARIGAATLMRRCGGVLTSQSVGPKILWLRRHRPDIFARTWRVMTCQTFLVYRLTGEVAIDRYTGGSFGPFYDVRTQEWTADFCGDIAAPELLPDLRWGDEIAGSVTARAAAETGLAAGTKVIVGTVDAAAEAISVGVLDAGDMMVMYGSTMFMILLTGAIARDPRLWYAPWTLRGLHASAAGLATSGTLTHWFRDQISRELDPAGAFAALAAEAAASPPGARGLIVLPHFSGERTPHHNPDARGCIFGLDLTHTRGDLYRAVLEGMACAAAEVFETYAAAGLPARRLLAVGGGTRNRLWLQAVSDISGLEQLLPTHTVGAAYGDAFLAAYATGHAGARDIAAWNPVAGTISPDPTTGGVYADTLAGYKALYARTATLLPRRG
jgi:xylulokinase